MGAVIDSRSTEQTAKTFRMHDATDFDNIDNSPTVFSSGFKSVLRLFVVVSLAIPLAVIAILHRHPIDDLGRVLHVSGIAEFVCFSFPLALPFGCTLAWFTRGNRVWLSLVSISVIIWAWFAQSVFSLVSWLR